MKKKPVQPTIAHKGTGDNHTDNQLDLSERKFVDLLEQAAAQPRLASLRKKTVAIKQTLNSSNPTGESVDSNGNCLRAAARGSLLSIRRDVLAAELEQVLAARTLERARYYLKRLLRGFSGEWTSPVNDINLRRWKEYDEIITDSLWVEPRRDTAGAHMGWYWGNFIPQIPRQLMLRYTKRNDWVLDCFLGSGTTLIECRRLGRNGIGVELNPEVARRAKQRIRQESNPFDIRAKVVRGDTRKVNLRRTLDRLAVEQVQLVIMHPPYHDIIEFSKERSDLSTARTTDEFLLMFGEAVDNATPLLESGRYLAVVIGDKYEGGEWIPLGFACMQEVLQRPYRLKSIIVKNFDETRAKRDQKQLWRYRALAGGFYVFKHEYVLVFQKK